MGEWSRVEGGDKLAKDITFQVKGVSNDIVTIFGEDVKVASEVIIRNCVVLPHKDLASSFCNQIIM